jgi:hypothetical protein
MPISDINAYSKEVAQKFDYGFCYGGTLVIFEK